MRRFIAAAALLGAVSFPRPAFAQFGFFEGLAKNFSDLSVYRTFAWFSNRPAELTGGSVAQSEQSSGLRGLGFEASFHIGDYIVRKSAKEKQQAVEMVTDTVSIAILHKAGTPPETTTTVIPKRVLKPKDYWLSAELSLGYSEIHGFKSTVQGLDIRGAVRELPTVSAYVTALIDSPVTPYFGASMGISQLQNFRAFVSDPGSTDLTYGASASTFQVGGSLGLYVDIGALGLFAEASYTHRLFEGIDWTHVNGMISDLVPRSLNFSTFALSFGGQIGLGLQSAGK